MNPWTHPKVARLITDAAHYRERVGYTTDLDELNHLAHLREDANQAGNRGGSTYDPLAHLDALVDLVHALTAYAFPDQSVASGGVRVENLGEKIAQALASSTDRGPAVHLEVRAIPGAVESGGEA